jgi:EAL and modified HD-GYP domain-containing signal transduction protein
MGVFSVLDAMLEMPMADAMKLVLVSDDIREALVSHTGKFSDIYNFIIDYESANWASVSRILIIYDLTPETIYETYAETLCWYRDMLADDSEETPDADSGESTDGNAVGEA